MVRRIEEANDGAQCGFVGTHRSVRRYYAFRYLAEFQYRFDRRFDLADLLERLAQTAVRAAPRAYAVVKVAYKGG